MLTINRIAAALGLAPQQRDFEIKKVVTDSRQAEENCLFVAIEGERVDGHSFIPVLSETFVNIAFLATKKAEKEIKQPYFLVEDALFALGLLAKAHLATLPTKVIGVTGSVGKTTTKNFILSALAPAMQVSGTLGNMNNELGVPLTGLAVKETDWAAVIEMGMRGLGQIEYLTQFITPDIAVVTNIGVAHLELLKSRVNIARAKLELVDALPEEGKALLNGDEPLLYGARPQKQCFYFGFSEHNDYRAVDVDGSSFILCYPDGSIDITLQVEGEHQIMNALAAFGAGHLLGIEPELLKQGLESFAGDGRRQFTERIGDITVIDDTYNASPDSMTAALKVLAAKPGRRIAVLGDMLELGAYEKQGHQEVAAQCAALKIDAVVAIGNRAKILYDALPEQIEKYYFLDRDAALPSLETLFLPGDTVLFKASNSMGFDKLTAALKERMGK